MTDDLHCPYFSPAVALLALSRHTAAASTSAAAAVHRQAGALQAARARGEREESVVWDCEATA